LPLVERDDWRLGKPIDQTAGSQKNVLNVMGGRKTQFGIWLVGGFNFFYFHPYLGKISILTHIFQMGWFNHHLVGESLCGLPGIVLFFGEPPPFFKLCCDQARLYTSLFYEADPF